MRYYLTCENGTYQKDPNKDEKKDVEKKEPYYTTGCNDNQ